jgi:hypothetical protein
MLMLRLRSAGASTCNVAEADESAGVDASAGSAEQSVMSVLALIVPLCKYGAANCFCCYEAACVL